MKNYELQQFQVMQLYRFLALTIFQKILVREATNERGVLENSCSSS